jgi:hypothetical protein
MMENHLRHPALRPTDVRRLVLVQHGALRRLLASVTGAVTRMMGGAPRNVVELAGLIRLVRRTLDDHMCFEERHLVPALEEVDPWGPERARSFLEEHRRQRAELAALDAELAGDPGEQTLALVLPTLVSDILADMEQEERDFLTPDILRDDLVTPEQDCG